jgi:hypothetical protein
MLYHLFEPGEDKPEHNLFHSEYDLAIENYLGGFGRADRRGQLISNWESDLEGEKEKERLTQITDNPLIASNDNPQKLTVDQLDDRTNKLAELRAEVARMNRDLSRLTENLAQGFRCSLP